MLLSKPSPRSHIRALAFLLGWTALAALLNYFSSRPQAQAAPDPVSPAPFVLIGGWALILLFYVPIYGVLIYTTRRWDWSLEEWGFGLCRRSWVGIGLAALILVLLWLPISPYMTDSTSTPTLGSQIPFLLFQGYARTAEELLYRGFALVLFQRLFSNQPQRQRLGWLWAIVLSSALFALVHTHKPDQMLQLFLGAAVPLAAITLLTRSLSLALVVHGAAGGGQVGALFGGLFFAGAAIYALVVQKKKEHREPPGGPPLQHQKEG